MIGGPSYEKIAQKKHTFLANTQFLKGIKVASENRCRFQESVKSTRNSRVVLRAVSKEILVEEVKEDLRSQNLPVQSVRRILNLYRDPFDLVLVSGIAEANDKAIKAHFIKSKAYVPFLG
ncbi:hypothetical protein EVAR_12459_1 [Eumeta japonica]|uniref:Uncharacterized protein n=1 Tax=Eumeta variegata TaxID=151549 RepID=A0A4C1TPH0_EUMVA|nr:hypothetical protein EVAR_12459_1 [Eumeta japonica]